VPSKLKQFPCIQNSLIKLKISPLRPLRCNNISILANRIAHLGQALVERIIFRTQRVTETLNGAVGVEFGPWLDTRGSGAGFQNEEESVEAVKEGLWGAAVDVVYLVGVGLCGC
jgi:hypothetical protein